MKCALKVGTGCKHDLGIAERFIAGSLAGAIAQSSIYPLEVRPKSTFCCSSCLLQFYAFFIHLAM